MKGIGFSGGKLATLTLAVSLLGAIGCDIFDEAAPTNARVVIEGGGGESFNLVISNNFTVFANQDGDTNEIVLNEADSIQASTPFNDLFSLGSGRRFYLKAYREPGLPEPITIRVLMNGDERYNSSSTLEGRSLEYVYTYR